MVFPLFQLLVFEGGGKNKASVSLWYYFKRVCLYDCRAKLLPSPVPLFGEKDIPTEVYNNRLSTSAYKHISCRVYKNLQTQGLTFNNASFLPF